MEEHEFLSESGVLVTSSKVVLGSKTFATRNIGSVDVKEKIPKRTLPIVIILIGLIILGPGVEANAGGVVVFGLIIICIGVLTWVMQKAKYELILLAGGGEVLALESTDKSYIYKIHGAISEAISVR
jgi:hypothetical protein